MGFIKWFINNLYKITSNKSVAANFLGDSYVWYLNSVSQTKKKLVG